MCWATRDGACCGKYFGYSGSADDHERVESMKFISLTLSMVSDNALIMSDEETSIPMQTGPVLRCAAFGELQRS
jgi:hypothetical protein